MKIIDDAKKIMRARREDGLRVLGLEVVTGRVSDPGTLVKRLDVLRAEPEALEPEVELWSSCRRRVEDVRGAIDQAALLVEPAEQDQARAQRLANEMTSLRPFLELLLPARLRAIDERESVANRVAARRTLVRETARFEGASPGMKRQALADRLLVARETAKPMRTFDGLVGDSDGEAACQRELDEHDALVADVERLPELEAEVGRLRAAAAEARAAAFEELAALCGLPREVLA